MPAVKAVLFNAYGTLLDIHAAMARHADRIGPHWRRVSHEWRAKQLEYTWVRTMAGPAHHKDFWQLTQDALDVVLSRHAIDPALRAPLLDAYRNLAPYPEIPSLLARLKELGILTGVLSNGEPGMLNDTLKAAGIAPLLDAVLSVESTEVFKPDRRVYGLGTARFEGPANNIAFVSANAWDAFGARVFGYRVFWLQREGEPDDYGMAASSTVITDLTALPDLLA